MTLNRRLLKRVHSPLKSPKRLNTSIRKKALIKQLSSDVQFGSASKANVKVVVRIRPYNSRELENGSRRVVKVVDEHMMIFDPKVDDEDFFFKGVRQRTRDFNRRQHKEQKFIFERIYNETSTNEEIFDETTKDIIDTILAGYNCSVFAYGATGAGKTFTMLGKPDCPGITFLTLMELYRRIDEQKDDKTCEVGVSYLEVYNETVRDLLQLGKPLNVQESGSQVLVPGLSLHKPKDADDILGMLEYGNQNRSQHPTDANAESSRSHAVFQVCTVIFMVRQQDRTANLKSNVSIAKLSMIDLAGSERGAATGFKGARFREGANINKSLLALGNCCILSLVEHDIGRYSEYLKGILRESLSEQCSTEHLVGQLLGVVKEFYIQLRANNVCLPEMEQLFEGLIDSMDESKILWADQQSEEKVLPKPCDSSLPVLDVARITHLPLLPSVYISPSVPKESQKVFRRSIMKTSKSVPSLNNAKMMTLSESASLVVEESKGLKLEITPRNEEHPFPESPVVSTYSPGAVDFIQEPSPVIGSAFAHRGNSQNHAASSSLPTNGVNVHSPLNNSSGSEPSYSLPTITTTEEYLSAPVISNESYLTYPPDTGSHLPETGIRLQETGNHLPEAGSHLPGSVQKVKSTPSLFVSMVNNETTSKSNGNVCNDFNTTELLEDIQPVECSMNATYAITPAKTLNVTMDMPSDVNILNTTVDLPNRTRDAPPYTCLSTTKAFKTDDITNPDVRSCIDNIMAGSKVALNTTIDLSGTGGIQSDAVCENWKEKTASKQLFQSKVLDSTFSLDNTSFGCSALDSKSPVPATKPEVHSQLQRSPLVPLENIQPPQALKEPVFGSGNEKLMRPPSSTKKMTKPGIMSFKATKAALPRITKGLLSASKTPRTPGTSGGMRKSLSTSSLNVKPNSATKQIQESPVFKRKYGLGSSMTKTTSFVDMRNQENLPPPSSGKLFTPNPKSLIYKETVSSLAKHNSLRQQQKT
ncbi:uncharacterized protein [Palaemon carinicauda]|uniref:uncharacterized protein n=1 Tax=Palaemon carinicauda TaxID=392227 RepID=UPI0035B6A1C1